MYKITENQQRIKIKTAGSEDPAAGKLLFFAVGDGTHRACFIADAAAGAFCVVNAGVKVCDGNGTADAFLLTDLAADAAVLAMQLGELSAFAGGAAHIDVFGYWSYGDQVLGTDLDALAAGTAPGGFNMGDAFFDGDGVVVAYMHAVPIAQTAKAACAGSAVEPLGSLATGDAVEVELFLGGIAIAVTVEHCHLRHHFLCLDAHDAADLCGGCHASGFAQIGGSTLFHDGGGIIPTARKAACTTVCLGQNL